MRKLLLLLLIFPALARANDAAFSGIGGSLAPLGSEHPNLRMRSEKVILIPTKEGFQTRATFDFINESSRAVNVKMGYPEINFGDGWNDGQEEKQRSGFLKFVTFVEGRKTAARRIFVSKKGGEDEIWWVKTVRFAPRESKTIRVETVSPFGGRVDWGFQNCVSYSFTGRNWKGNVARSELEIHIAEPGLWCAVGNSWNGEKALYWKPSVNVRKTGAILRKTWTNWEAQSSVYVGVWKTLPFWLMEVGGNSQIVDERVLAKVTTFRVGEKPPQLPPLGVNAPQAFTLDSTTFVSFWHLTRKLDALADEKLKVKSNYDAKNRVATLTMGYQSLHFTVGQDQMRLVSPRGETRFSGAAPQLLREESGGNSLFVPLGSVSRALGLKIQIMPEKRRFSIEKGDWLR